MKNSRRIKELLQNENARVLAGNFLALTALKAVGYIFPLVTLPYLTAVVGVEKFGELAFASAIMVFVETITDWGFNYTATRDVAQNRERLDVVSRIFSEVLFSKLLLMMLCFCGLYLATVWIGAFHDYRLLLLLTFAYIPGHILFPEWLFQAFERMKYITILNVLSKTLFTVLIFIVIRKQSDYIYQPLLLAGGFAVSGIIAQWIIIKKFQVRIIVPGWRALYTRLRRSTDMFICLFFPNLYSNFSTILLKSTAGEYATGIYSAGRAFQNITDQVVQLLSRTFFPFLARHNDKHIFYTKIAGIVTAGSCLFVFVFADLLVKVFYADSFHSAATVVRILSITPFLLYLNDAFGVNYLVIKGREKLLKNITVFGSIAGFAAAWLLIPAYDYIGAAVTMVFSRGLLGICTYLMAKREQNMEHSNYMNKINEVNTDGNASENQRMV